MDRQLWIRSPGFEGLLRRSIERYGEFMTLFKVCPKALLVPTLDIDLIWHTHQCSPARYNAESFKLAGKQIDHDDKLGKSTLDPGFGRLSDVYCMRFGKEYRICLCWDCALLANLVAEQAQMDHAAIAKCVSDEVTYYRAVEIARRKA